MENELARNYLESIRKQFAYYRMLGTKTLAQLTDAQLALSPDHESNSIARIVDHLHGNMRSRFTDFWTSDGEKAWRNREGEFSTDFVDRAGVEAKWTEGWAVVFGVLDTMQPEQLTGIVYIRQQGHTALEALNRQLAHYAYHIGQMVYLGKHLRGVEWQSLSIPKGQSAAFNAAKRARGKGRGHYTDEFIENPDESTN